MKRNFIKFCYVGLGSVALLSACVEADNLDSIEQLQEVTAQAKLNEAKVKEAQERQDLADKVYFLQTSIANLKGDILTLQSNENQIEFISNGYELEVESATAELAAAEDMLVILTQLKATSNFQTAIDSVTAKMVVSATDYEKKMLAYEKANTASTLAGQVKEEAASAYNAVAEVKEQAMTDIDNALNGYNALSELQLQIVAYTSEIAALENVISKWEVTVAEEKSNLAEKSADYNDAYADYLVKKAIVDNQTVNGGTADSDDVDDLNDAANAWSDADSDLQTAQGKYSNAVDKLNDNLETLSDTEDNLSDLQDDVLSYNKAVADLNSSNAKLPTLLTALQAAENEYTTLSGKTSAAASALAAIDAIGEAQSELLSTLQDEDMSMDEEIANLKITINKLNASIEKKNDLIAQLAGGYNTDTNELVAEWIAAANRQIAAYEAIIASYSI